MNKKRWIISVIMLMVGLCYLLYVGQETEEAYKENTDLLIDYEFLAENYEILETNICTEAYPVEENSVLKEYFKETLEEAKEFQKQFSTEDFIISPMSIEYFIFDFNGDGMEDYLMCFRGSGWEGSGGNLVKILIQMGDGSLKEVLSVNARMIRADGNYAPVAVLNERKSGFYSLFFPETDNTIWSYDEETKSYRTFTDLEETEETEEPTVSESVMQLKYPSKEQYEIMIEMIKNEDFSCLDIQDSYVEDYVHVSDYTEWVTCDIDKDGFDELILQDKEPVAESQTYRIKAIFTYRPNGMHCVEVDFNDGTEYYFLGENGNLIYCSEDYLADENFGIYICNKINELGEMQAVYRLKIIYEYEDKHTSFLKSVAVEESDGNEWEVMHLTREEFLIAYEELMGVAFEDPEHYFGY